MAGFECQATRIGFDRLVQPAQHGQCIAAAIVNGGNVRRRKQRNIKGGQRAGKVSSFVQTRALAITVFRGAHHLRCKHLKLGFPCKVIPIPKR